jgi:hypothetical protein
MGIPGFSTWLRQRYPEAFEDPKQGGQASTVGHDAVYIDLASTLHTVTRKAYSRNAFHVLLHRRLDELIDSLGPKKRVVIAMDGPAPLAKLLEQRRRRKKEADKTTLNEDEEEEEDIKNNERRGYRHGKKGHGANRVSSLFLTTGTLFMLEVHNSLICYIIKRLGDPKYEHLEYEFSDSTVKGEGELKIVSRLLQHDHNDAESHAVVGADSDLLLMTMIASRPHVYVVDDLPRRKGKKGGKQKKAKVFKSDDLAAIWKESLLKQDPAHEDVSILARDLTLLAILSSGNDYLPGCQGLTLKDNTRPGLWNLYLDMRRQPEWFGQSLTKCVPIQDHDISSPSSSSSSSDKKTIDTLPVPTFAVKINGPMVAALITRNIEQKYVPIPSEKRQNFGNIEGNWKFGMKNVDRKKIRAAQAAAQTPQILMRKPADPAAYIKGLEWTLTMYSTGGVDDYRYSYPAAPPTLMNLVQYLDSKNHASDDIDDEESAIQPRLSSMSFNDKAALQPLLPAACALALLPARSRSQAASALRHLMDADSPVAEIYAVCKECQRLAKSIREANAELEEVRKELASVQDKLSSIGLDSETALEVDDDLSSALEKWEAAGEPLRDLLRELSRSHHKHVMESHPYKPFPTEDLEEAMLSVPVNKYPFWERQLTRFGREIVYKRSKQKESNEFDDSEQSPKWMKECIRFANAYPKVADAQYIQEESKHISRNIVPLHPYMQPGGAIRLPPRRSFSTSTNAMDLIGTERSVFAVGASSLNNLLFTRKKLSTLQMSVSASGNLYRNSARLPFVSWLERASIAAVPKTIPFIKKIRLV